MRTRAKLITSAVVVLGLVLGSLLGGVLRDGDAASGALPASSGSTAFAADRVLTGIASAGGGADVRELERTVQAEPNDGQSLVLLGYAYQQRWRETADASNLPRSEAALRRALRLDPQDPLAVTGLGSLALIRHDFRSALDLGRRAQRLAPSSARGYGVVGDALIELGRYEEAFRAFERMVALRPSVASYARIAYARELIGDLPGARQAMQLAADAASGQREPAAWANVELAKLDLRAGRVQRAERHLRAALALLPGYVYASEQLARVAAARGDLRGAIRSARAAATAVPLPQFVALLADLYDRTGNRRAAREQIATVRAIDRILTANGVRTDVESVVFDADHRIGTATLVARAARRPRGASVDPGRRRTRMGARAHRPLPRGAAVVGALAQARHTRRARLLPPRRDRALRREPERGPRVGTPRPRARPGVLRALGAGRPASRVLTSRTVRGRGSEQRSTAPTREEPYDGQETWPRACADARRRGRDRRPVRRPRGARWRERGQPPGGAADLARSRSGHQRLLHVPQLRAREVRPGRADHGRQPRRGAELGPELLRLRPERHVLDRDRQRP